MGEVSGGGGGAQLAFEISEDPDGSSRVALRGELDMSTAPGLDSALSPLIAKQPDRLIIEAGELEFADSSAIALLVRWAKLVRQIELRDPPELLKRVIIRMGLSEQLHVPP